MVNSKGALLSEDRRHRSKMVPEDGTFNCIVNDIVLQTEMMKAL